MYIVTKIENGSKYYYCGNNEFSKDIRDVMRFKTEFMADGIVEAMKERNIKYVKKEEIK